MAKSPAGRASPRCGQTCSVQQACPGMRGGKKGPWTRAVAAHLACALHPEAQGAGSRSRADAGHPIRAAPWRALLHIVAQWPCTGWKGRGTDGRVPSAAPRAQAGGAMPHLIRLSWPAHSVAQRRLLSMASARGRAPARTAGGWLMLTLHGSC